MGLFDKLDPEKLDSGGKDSFAQPHGLTTSGVRSVLGAQSSPQNLVPEITTPPAVPHSFAPDNAAKELDKLLNEPLSNNFAPKEPTPSSFAPKPEFHFGAEYEKTMLKDSVQKEGGYEANLDDTQIWYADPDRQTIEIAVLIRRENAQRVILSKNEFRIGRKPEFNDFAMPENMLISGVHAIFRRNLTNNEWSVEDTNSTNHIRVNEVRITPAQQVPIKDGDVVRLANEYFDFKLESTTTFTETTTNNTTKGENYDI